MGLFMDGNGVPLAFNIIKGSENEQKTLQPIEERIISDFKLSKFVVCTDAGLSSVANRKFNDIEERAFITTQSIKKLKAYLKIWALDSQGWHLSNDIKTYDISILDEEKDIDKVFFKERWINENGLEQRIIVTYSIKYRNYQRKIRSSQLERAEKAIAGNQSKLDKCKQNDFKRFINKTNCTAEGEIAEKKIYSINTDLIKKEEAFDGFYAVSTNLEDDVEEVIKVNKKRWEIEECFRIIKSEFVARPVYLKRDDRIVAHFITCFISLIIYRLLENKLKEEFTCSEIIDSLKDMNFQEVKGEGYIPQYTRTDFTDALHAAFGFRTDYEIVINSQMKKIFKETKS